MARSRALLTRIVVSGLLVLRSAHAETHSSQSGVPSRAVADASSLGELGKLTTELRKRWQESGEIASFRPRLLGQGDTLPVLLTPSWLDDQRADCVTVVALASPNLSFLFEFEDEGTKASRRAWPVPSAAGLSEVTRCGHHKSLLAHLKLTLRSRRGVVQILALRSSAAPSPSSELLPSRNPGPSLPTPQVGPRPYLAPRKTRVALLKESYKGSGAEAVQETTLSADESGSGSSVVHLDPGCHKLALLAESEPKSPPDLDARLYTLTSGEELSIDQEHSGQALLQYCVGRAERFRLDFTGAGVNSDVLVLQARFPLPKALPVEWGPVARAHLARALLEPSLPSLAEAPIFSALGVRGSTRFALEVDPEACYLAAVAPLRGEVTRMSLATDAGVKPRQATSSTASLGTSLGFCAGGKESVSLEVQGLGSGLAWILGVFRTGPPLEQLK